MYRKKFKSDDVNAKIEIDLHHILHHLAKKYVDLHRIIKTCIRTKQKYKLCKVLKT